MIHPRIRPAASDTGSNLFALDLNPNHIEVCLVGRYFFQSARLDANASFPKEYACPVGQARPVPRRNFRDGLQRELHLLLRFRQHINRIYVHPGAVLAQQKSVRFRSMLSGVTPSRWTT
jgi:hypothetical protein